jgi:cell division protein FtsI/penicillin-binding protein 2
VCDNALFVAAAPYDDPDIVISVVLEKGYSGGLASLTAARILEAYYNEQ